MIKLTNVSKQYPTGTHTEFARDVALEIDEGEFVAIVKQAVRARLRCLISGRSDRDYTGKASIQGGFERLTDAELATFAINPSVSCFAF